MGALTIIFLATWLSMSASTDFLIRTNINNDLIDLERKKLAAVFQLVQELNFSIQPDHTISKPSTKWRDYAKIEQVR